MKIFKKFKLINNLFKLSIVFFLILTLVLIFFEYRARNSFNSYLTWSDTVIGYNQSFSADLGSFNQYFISSFFQLSISPFPIWFLALFLTTILLLIFNKRSLLLLKSALLITCWILLFYMQKTVYSSTSLYFALGFILIFFVFNIYCFLSIYAQFKNNLKLSVAKHSSPVSEQQNKVEIVMNKDNKQLVKDFVKKSKTENTNIKIEYKNINQDNKDDKNSD